MNADDSRQQAEPRAIFSQQKIKGANKLRFKATLQKVQTSK
jgi:hypothetical protein